jgi:eukaryotic-like serine/threonine-protein kinase
MENDCPPDAHRSCLPPGSPRLRGHGFWRKPAGTVHPFVVMDWVEGTPLYAWASAHPPSSRQVLRLLAQLARALQATHAASAVHRDVKGDNILVRSSDARAVLTDFGAGHYRAAARITWQAGPPGTPAYCSPQAGLFIVRSVRSPDAHYMAQPADDVFALGVTAYRLVTGEYPPLAEPRMDETGAWYMQEAPVRPPRDLCPRVDTRLQELILRMLSLSPEARGSAAEMAELLETAAEQAGPEADQPLCDAPPANSSRPPSERRRLRRQLPQWRIATAVALGGLFMLGSAWWAVCKWHAEAPERSPVASGASQPAADTTDVGDLAPAIPLASMEAPKEQGPIAQEFPPKPLPGQIQPDARGQCPEREQVALNGGCWVEARMTDSETCERNGYVVVRGKCYSPALTPRRKPQPTSNPQDPPQ